MAAIGSAIKPVYVDANGAVRASNANVGSETWPCMMVNGELIQVYKELAPLEAPHFIQSNPSDHTEKCVPTSSTPRNVIYDLTNDTERDRTKTYYVVETTTYREATDDDFEGDGSFTATTTYYEKSGSIYTKTTDTERDETKTYYVVESMTFREAIDSDFDSSGEFNPEISYYEIYQDPPTMIATKEYVDDELKGQFDKIYPVGSVYQSVNNALPSSFEGDWTELQEFLLGTEIIYVWKRVS